MVDDVHGQVHEFGPVENLDLRLVGNGKETKEVNENWARHQRLECSLSALIFECINPTENIQPPKSSFLQMRRSG
jgi:hypothetical protein